MFPLLRKRLSVLAGPKSRTLSPSIAGQGGNVYLGKIEFSIMFMVAVIVHLLIVIAFSLVPQQEVNNVPVRVLNLKLGDGGALNAAPRLTSDVLQRVYQDEPEDDVEVLEEPPAAESPKEESTPKPAPKTKAIETEEAHGVKVTKEKGAPKKKTPEAEKRIKITDYVTQEELERGKKREAEALAATKEPRKLVRENRVRREATPTVPAVPSSATSKPAATSGSSAGMSFRQKQEQDEVVKRYEQELSAWLAKHKVYPTRAQSNGIEGEGVVRLRINRLGNVTYATVEKTTGHRLLDEALIAMVKRANPVPAVPSNYPAGQMFEFLIPIRFNIPR